MKNGLVFKSLLLSPLLMGLCSVTAFSAGSGNNDEGVLGSVHLTPKTASQQPSVEDDGVSGQLTASQMMSMSPEELASHQAQCSRVREIMEDRVRIKKAYDQLSFVEGTQTSISIGRFEGPVSAMVQFLEAVIGGNNVHNSLQFNIDVFAYNPYGKPVVLEEEVKSIKEPKAPLQVPAIVKPDIAQAGILDQSPQTPNLGYTILSEGTINIEDLQKATESFLPKDAELNQETKCPKIVQYINKATKADLPLIVKWLNLPGLDYFDIADKSDSANATDIILPWYLGGHKGVEKNNLYKLIWIDSKETVRQISTQDLPKEWVEKHRLYHFEK